MILLFLTTNEKKTTQKNICFIYN